MYIQIPYFKQVINKPFTKFFHIAFPNRTRDFQMKYIFVGLACWSKKEEGLSKRWWLKKHDSSRPAAQSKAENTYSLMKWRMLYRKPRILPGKLRIL